MFWQLYDHLKAHELCKDELMSILELLAMVELNAKRNILLAILNILDEAERKKLGLNEVRLIIEKLLDNVEEFEYLILCTGHEYGHIIEGIKEKQPKESYIEQAVK